MRRPSLTEVETPKDHNVERCYTCIANRVRDETVKNVDRWGSLMQKVSKLEMGEDAEELLRDLLHVVGFALEALSSDLDGHTGHWSHLAEDAPPRGR